MQLVEIELYIYEMFYWIESIVAVRGEEERARARSLLYVAVATTTASARIADGDEQTSQN